MPKYRVNLFYHGSASYDVEGDDEWDAIQEAVAVRDEESEEEFRERLTLDYTDADAYEDEEEVAMTQKQTPGPWKVTGPASPEWGLEPTRPEEIDFDFQEIHGHDGDLVAFAAGEANARLIATAVNSHEDLLAALESLLATEDDPTDSCQWCGNFLVEDEAHCRVVDCPGVEARAAIAKATQS